MIQICDILRSIWKWGVMARTQFWFCVHCDLDIGDMTLAQRHDTPLGHGQQLCEILSRSNIAVRNYGPDTNFGYVCTVTLTEIWHTLGQEMCGVLSRSNFAMRSYGRDTNFRLMWTVTLTLEIWPRVKFMTHPLVMDNNCVKYYPDPTWQWRVIAQTDISSMCAMWPYDIGSRSWHTLGPWKTIVWNIIQIHLGSEELCPGHGFSVCVNVQCDLDIWDMTFGQCHDTPLGQGQQLCEICRSNMAIRSYTLDTDFGYVYTVTLTLGQGDRTSLGHGQQLC